MLVCVCMRAYARIRAALVLRGLVFVYILLCTGYVQVPGNPLSSHEFLSTRKYGILLTKYILNKSCIMSL